jgi:hypothetical protein
VPNRKGRHLLDNLDVDADAAGVFGICYSVLTWKGVGKGLGWSPRSWIKTVGKMIEDGHATTFLIQRSGRGHRVTLTGISDNGWVFQEGPASTVDWARDTASATTYVYYIQVDQAFIDHYEQVKNELQGTRTAYAVVWPNLPRTTSTYQNCVSHSHYLMYRLGLARWTSTKGWWVPSVSNWVDWFKSFVPTSHGGYRWKYKVFHNINTHIP